MPNPIAVGHSLGLVPSVLWLGALGSEEGAVTHG